MTSICWEQQFSVGEPIVKTIDKNVDSADVVVLIIGDRVGSVFAHDGKSMLEYEIELATKKGKPILVFIKNFEVQHTNLRLNKFKNESFPKGSYRCFLHLKSSRKN